MHSVQYACTITSTDRLVVMQMILCPLHIFITDQSYSLEMLRFLNKLGKHWEKFAKFIGFAEDEVKRLKSSAPTTKRQIRNFSKVWRMPDLTFEKNEEVLELTLHEAGIDTGTCTCIYVI